MIARGWYDDGFVRDWTNGPLLVRQDTGRLLTAAEIGRSGPATQYVAWRADGDGPIIYDPTSGRYDADAPRALFGDVVVDTVGGRIACRPAFDVVARACAEYPPARVEQVCGIDADLIERAAHLLWESRPVAYYAWSGVEMQSNATQIARAIAQLYVLTGSFDRPGGNVLFASVPTNDVSGAALLPAGQRARTLGLAERPLGPGRMQHVTSEEIYCGILERQPYAVRGLVGFGANLLMAHADGRRGREALAALEFYVHADLFMTPTAELADVVLPVASAFERDALKVGFEISADAQSLVQLRQPVVAPRGEARADTAIVFDLACRLGLGDHFWNGDIEAASRYQLAPSGVSLDELRAAPSGVRLPLETRYRKFAEAIEGSPRGFATPSRRIELYSETFLEHGYPPVPNYVEPLVSPRSRPDLAARYPLVLTCAKHVLFCETQHRALPSLRRLARDPEVEMHPAAAAARGIVAGDWVEIETPSGRVRARARLNDTLDVTVVCGQHGWWQACRAIGAPGYDPFGPGGANYNLLITCEAIDPISGSVPHRAYVCEIRRVGSHQRSLVSRSAKYT
jgi:anaerobic selenocysteine-containing dehydrogenase